MGAGERCWGRIREEAGYDSGLNPDRGRHARLGHGLGLGEAGFRPVSGTVPKIEQADLSLTRYRAT